MKSPLPLAQHGWVLADRIMKSLREAIVQGYFEPGEKLDQDSIAAEFGVSRTPVREALQRLELEGFIELRPHYGAFVPELSRQDIYEVYQVRALVEAEVVRQATPLIPESVLDELERSFAAAVAIFDNGDRNATFENDIYFHDTLRRYASNELLKQVLDGIANRVALARCFAMSRPGPHITDSLEEHRAILHAIRQREAEKAAELMTFHLQKSGRRIQELVGHSAY